jgi:nicotinate-nucleotide--dimethylbenzimidazole phosphoribosyltransferase
MLEETIANIEGFDHKMAEDAQKRLDNLTKPKDSLGRLEELAKRVVGITKRENPVFDKKVVFTMAGDHGVAEEGVSCYPAEVTPQMVKNFLAGGAGINVLARTVSAEVIVVDMGVAKKIESKNSRLKVKKIGYGTKNIAKGPAMSRDEAVRAIEAGISIFKEEPNIDIVGTGDMGIANTTPASAITSCITEQPPEMVTGRGTGIDNETLERKIDVVKRALSVNNPDSADPIDVLCKVGGFEIGGLCGIILAAAAARVPVVIDGFISTSAALIAAGLAPSIKEFMIASHCSAERGHKIALHHLGLSPLLDLNLRLGEGTGAALGIFLIEAGCKVLCEMATFESAGVSRKI